MLLILIISNWAKLLGDPNFPTILDSAKQGERILRFEHLYEDYSRLGLSEPSDRPRGIAGLEQRLIRTMNVDGRFGTLDDPNAPGLFRRSLLWHRGKDTPRLNRIKFPSQQVQVPSWSWMAWEGGKQDDKIEYPGGINYYRLSFNDFEWQELQPPWKRSCNDRENLLAGKARTYKREPAQNQDARFIYDCPGSSKHEHFRCVVLGVQIGEPELKQRRHYVLLIAKTEKKDSAGNDLWERVGAGYLLGRDIEDDTIKVHIG
jgi:hypothetical protein